MTETTTKTRAPRKAEDKPADRREAKTRVRASVLRGALKDVVGIVEGRNTIPILDNVVLRVADQRISLTATDLDHWAIRDCASDDRDGPDSREWLDGIRGFAIALPAKQLSDLLGEIDGDAMVTIVAPSEVNDDWRGQVTISAGKARFRLQCLPVTDFPLPPPFEVQGAFDLTCSQMADALAAVDHAISTEEARYYLNGVYLHPDEDALDLRFATTDGHRLARRLVDGPEGSTVFPAVIVARKTVGILEKLLASSIKAAGDDSTPRVEVESAVSGARLRFAMPAADGGDVEIIAKAIDGTFPDYTRVIPSDPKFRAKVERSVLAESVKRVAVLADAKSRAVRMTFTEGQITLSARVEVGEASEDVACEYFGPDFEIGFDSKYVREALAALASDIVALQFGEDPVGPVRLSGWENDGEVGALLQVLMPVRV